MYGGANCEGHLCDAKKVANRCLWKLRRSSRHVHCRGMWSWSSAMAWFFACEARGRVEFGTGRSHLALHRADRHALFIRWLVGARAPTPGRRPDQRTLVRVHQPTPEPSQDPGVRHRRILDLEQAPGTRSIWLAWTRRGRQTQFEPYGPAGASRRDRYANHTHKKTISKDYLNHFPRDRFRTRLDGRENFGARFTYCRARTRERPVVERARAIECSVG